MRRMFNSDSNQWSPGGAHTAAIQDKINTRDLFADEEFDEARCPTSREEPASEQTSSLSSVNTRGQEWMITWLGEEHVRIDFGAA